jgi:hypothetical protein
VWLAATPVDCGLRPDSTHALFKPFLFLFI